MSPNFMKHVYGWLLLTPAAILLIAFTHYPTVATIFDSLFSKGTAIRPSRFVGLANYEMMIEDPIFWFSHRHGSIGQPGSAGSFSGPHSLFYTNHPADDRRCQYMAVLLYA